MEIFIVDDDLIQRMIVSKMIKIIDPTLLTTQCENGKIGLAMLGIGVNLSHIVLVIRHFVLIFSFSGMILF
jgi:hypothetical protein